MDEAAIDRATYDALVDTTGAEFVRELVDTFLGEAPRMLDDLRDALVQGDAERFRRAAHSLKSNANTFGALQLAAMAKALELGGLAAARASPARPIDDAANAFARASAALKELARG